MAGLDLMMYKDGVKDGRLAGREEGRKEGILSILVGMVKDKLLSVAEAAERFGVSEKEFVKLAKI